MIKKNAILIGIVLIFSQSYSSSFRGTFPNIGTDARGMALGRACGALTGISSAYWNPSVIAFLKEKTTTSTYTRFGAFPISCGFISYIGNDDGHGAAALSWNYLGAKLYEGEYSWNENTISYSWAKAIQHNLAVGITTKLLLVNSGFDKGNATGGSADIGLIYLKDNLGIGFTVHDVVSRIYWKTNREEKMPITYDLGASYKFFNESIDLLFDLSSEDRFYPNEIKTGLESWIFSERFAVRVGIIRKLNESNLSIFSSGFGLNFVNTNKAINYGLNYAFVLDKNILGTIHCLSLEVKWK